MNLLVVFGAEEQQQCPFAGLLCVSPLPSHLLLLRWSEY